MSYILRTGQVIAGLEPEDVQAAAVALGFYGGQLGPGDSLEQPDALAHAIAAYLGHGMRRIIGEREHGARHEQSSRALAALLGLVEARERTRRHRTAMDDAL